LINQSKNIELLLKKSEWTTEERQWLLFFLENSNGQDLKEIMEELFYENVRNSNSIDPIISERLLSNIHQKIIINRKQEKAKRVRMWTLRIAAACVVGFLALSTFLWLKNNSKQPIAQMQVNIKKYKKDIQPGGNKAVLTLADGSTIALEDAKNGVLTQQGNTKIIKQNGKIDYNATVSGANKIMYNTISTPRGGQYRVELPDGSEVWLNAASSLRFPTTFAGKERRVEITGEVYFEVAKNKAMPFIVSVNGAEVQVLGTHFDVMAYNDEPAFKTTLLEGSVKFVKDGNFIMLKPGQQSQLTKSGQIKVVSDVNLTTVVAWKNGFFDFEGLDFETIARQLSRWYNVEVIYDRKIDDLFYAEIPRNTKLSDVLKALELTGKVHFEIEGTKIIVLP
jgi:ferric-dicitrate binding protein FerR (iron transport regulator)